MAELYDHPDVRQIEATGFGPVYQDVPDHPKVGCPVCGRMLFIFESIYVKEQTNVAVGCTRCLTAVDADEYESEEKKDD